ncbi:hypothetical protein GCM10009814_34030 [Lapillicoccus jejuensis]
MPQRHSKAPIPATRSGRTGRTTPDRVSATAARAVPTVTRWTAAARARTASGTDRSGPASGTGRAGADQRGGVGTAVILTPAGAPYAVVWPGPRRGMVER